MPISVVCANGHKINAKDKLAGKKVKCPKCGAVIQIPKKEASPTVDLGLTEITDDKAASGLAPLDPLGSTSSDPLADPLTPSQDPLAGGLTEIPGDPLGDLPGDPLPGDPAPSDALQPVSATDPLQGGVDPLLGGGDPLALQGGAEPLQQTPTQPSTLGGQQPAQSASAPNATLNDLSPLQLYGSIGGGAVLGFVSVVFILAMLFGGGGQSSSASEANATSEANAEVAQGDGQSPSVSEMANQANASQEPPRNEPSRNEPPQNQSDGGPPPNGSQPPQNQYAGGPPTNYNPAGNGPGPGAQYDPSRQQYGSSRSGAPVRGKLEKAVEPNGLARFVMDKRLDIFKLPARSWASAYDEATGRLAVTNDQLGILIYDVSEALAGRPALVATLGVDGVPTALCFKQHGDQRSFIYGGNSSSRLLMVEAASPDSPKDFPLNGAKYVLNVKGSPSPEDPFVYFASAGGLGRLNLNDGTFEGNSKINHHDVSVAPDGRTLFTRSGVDLGKRRPERGHAYRGAWEDFFKASNDNEAPRPPGRVSGIYVNLIGDRVAVGQTVQDYPSGVGMRTAGFFPMNELSDHSLVVGTTPSDFVVASSNDLRRLITIPLPYESGYMDERASQEDPRRRPGLNSHLNVPYSEMHVDNQRKLAILAFTSSVFVVQLDKLNLPAQPDLRLATKMPETVAPGETVELDIELVTDNADVKVDFVPHTMFLPNERERFVTYLKPGETVPRPIRLRGYLRQNESEVELEDLKPFRSMKFPIQMRIGHEYVTATGISGKKLALRRTENYTHSSATRIVILDKDGNDITSPKPSPKMTAKNLRLGAAINDTQTEIFVRSLDPMKGMKLPLEIKVGGETMTVVAVEEFRKKLTVTRPEPYTHSVTDEVVLVDTIKMEELPSLPVIEGRKFRWKPSPKQLGKQRLRLQARVGDSVREIFWETTVGYPELDLPFKVVGIEPQPGTTKAVIWGQSELPALDPRREAGEYSFYVGVYDYASQEVVKYVESPYAIQAAALHSSGVYASFFAYDVSPKADPEAERRRQSESRSKKSTRIARFDPETLKLTKDVPVENHCSRVQVIGDKYLAASSRWGGATYGFEIPTLEATEQGNPFKHSIAGRVKNGWVWDGVLYDEKLAKAKLLIWPVHFDRAARESSVMEGVSKGRIFLKSNGAYTSTWSGSNRRPGPMERGLPAIDRPGGLSTELGQLSGVSWADLSNPGVGHEELKSTVTLIDRSGLPGDHRSHEKMLHGYVSQSDGVVHAAILGNLYQVPLDSVLPEEESFRFVEEQSEFAFMSGRKAKLNYSAPGAARYRMEVWYRWPDDFREEAPNILDSTDGSFEIDLDDQEQYKSLALNAIGIGSRDKSAERLTKLKDYMKRITKPYRALTGRNPRGVPAPLYVSVFAEHEDGVRKAGLAHVFLVDIPIKSFSAPPAGTP